MFRWNDMNVSYTLVICCCCCFCCVTCVVRLFLLFRGIELLCFSGIYCIDKGFDENIFWCLFRISGSSASPPGRPKNTQQTQLRPSSIQWRQEATNAWKKQEKETTKSTRSNKTASDGNGKADKQKVENQTKFTSKHQQEKQKPALLGFFSGCPPRCRASTAEGTKAIASAWWIAIAPTSPLDRQVLYLESGNTDLEPWKKLFSTPPCFRIWSCMPSELCSLVCCNARGNGVMIWQ